MKMMDGAQHPDYINVPPMTKTRSTNYLPTPEHSRSVSCDDTQSASSSSTNDLAGVRLRVDSSHGNSEVHSPSKILYVAAYEYNAERSDELSLPLGSIVRLINRDTHEEGWYYGELDGHRGLFPSNYVRLLGEEENLIEYGADDIRTPSNRDLDECMIGRGATANVYKVDLRWCKRDKEGKKLENGTNFIKAALKRFHIHACEGALPCKSFLDMLKREANLVNGLRHPNIVQLFGVCPEQSKFGLLLELCEGGSLRTVYQTATEKIIPFRVLIDWAKQIASGMEYLIGQGYVHRDLKADNILVKDEVCYCAGDEEWSDDWCPKCGCRPLDRLQLKITDFGVTRKLTTEANRMSTVGTYAWMAPEAFRDSNYSEASDVWSFGVVLWELLSKKEPYQGENQNMIAINVVHQKKSLVIDESCPMKWKTIMQRCWEVNPHDRPTFHDLVAFFEDYSKDGQLDTQLKRVQTIIAHNIENIYTKCQMDQNKELDELFKNLYSPIGGIERKNRRSLAPDPKARRQYKTGKRLEISAPVGDVQHLVSVKRDEVGNNLKVYVGRDQSGGGSTLPRSFGRMSQYSTSTPNLNQMFDGNAHEFGGKTMERKNAIRIKSGRQHRPSDATSPMSNASGLYDDQHLASIDSADEAEHSKSRTTFRNKIWQKFRNTKKRESHDDDEENSKNRSSTVSTSSCNKNTLIKPMTRGAIGHFPMEHASRSRTTSGMDDSVSPRTSNKVSPSDKNGALKKPSNPNFDVRGYSENNVPRPAQLPSSYRPSPLDLPIPPSSNSPDQGTMIIPMSISRRQTTASSSTDTSYELLGGPSPRMNYVVTPSLYTPVPVGCDAEPTHYYMENGRISADRNAYSYLPVGGGRDDYVPIADVKSDMRMSSSTITNPQYYQCNKRPNPINIFETTTPSSSGIGTCNSSLSLNEPPDIPAPPPPIISMSPPTRLAPGIAPDNGVIANLRF
ncbi:unnamed protein product [Caenorhabditis bovis]|uniref:Mitogen-activated protein kinase kinase kinase n=1 Tax=Caenorhabditis bovis TaxID=2654633 RepID=A0A8S1EL55_9PELO|nr:unnamed protein product [Caenorhabditis bovis]